MQKPTKPTKRAKAKVETEVEKIVPSVTFVGDSDLMHNLIAQDLTKLKKSFGVSIDVKNDKIYITSDIMENCRKTANVLEEMFDWFDRELTVNDSDVDELIQQYLPKPFPGTKYRNIFITHDNVEISPRTESQDSLIKIIKNKKISVAYGSSGGGKTFISVLMGLKMLLDGRFENITICRPLVTVGGKDNIGFLPGELSDKIFPFNSVLHQCFVELIGEKGLEQLIKEKKLIFSPISFLRGSTINSYVIADEAQNFTRIEILTLLTRLGKYSKLVCTGDLIQQDLLTKTEKTGLELMTEKLQDLDRVGFVKFTEKDIQRDSIVGDIIRAFE